LKEEFELIWSENEARIYEDSFFKIQVEVEKDIKTIVDALKKTIEALKDLHKESD
jgi:hypothetical protein